MSVDERPSHRIDKMLVRIVWAEESIGRDIIRSVVQQIWCSILVLQISVYSTKLCSQDQVGGLRV
jgi:hypothetical protein